MHAMTYCLHMVYVWLTIDHWCMFKDGKTAFHFICNKGTYHLVAEMIKRGANLSHICKVYSLG